MIDHFRVPQFNWKIVGKDCTMCLYCTVCVLQKKGAIKHEKWKFRFPLCFSPNLYFENHCRYWSRFTRKFCHNYSEDVGWLSMLWIRVWITVWIRVWITVWIRVWIKVWITVWIRVWIRVWIKVGIRVCIIKERSQSKMVGVSVAFISSIAAWLKVSLIRFEVQTADLTDVGMRPANCKDTLSVIVTIIFKSIWWL